MTVHHQKLIVTAVLSGFFTFFVLQYGVLIMPKGTPKLVVPKWTNPICGLITTLFLLLISWSE